MSPNKYTFREPPMIKKYLIFTPLLILLNACSNNEASHLPSPIELPGAIIGSVIENTVYQSRRNKVEAYVSKHYLAIRDDAYRGGGKTLEGAFDAAGLRGSNRINARNDFVTQTKDIFQNNLLVEDALIQIFSALYVNESTAKDKRINGFNYIDARTAINNFSANNFETLRSAIKQGHGSKLDELATILRINNPQKRTVFKQKAQSHYKRIYLEPVTVALMVQS